MAIIQCIDYLAHEYPGEYLYTISNFDTENQTCESTDLYYYYYNEDPYPWDQIGCFDECIQPTKAASDRTKSSPSVSSHSHSKGLELPLRTRIPRGACAEERRCPIRGHDETGDPVESVAACWADDGRLYRLFDLDCRQTLRIGFEADVDLNEETLVTARVIDGCFDVVVLMVSMDSRSYKYLAHRCWPVSPIPEIERRERRYRLENIARLLREHFPT